MIPNPCHGCTKRYRACSGTCHDPDPWREEQARIKAARKAYYESRNPFLTDAAEKRHFDYVKNSI